MLTPNELFLPFGGSYVCANFGEKSIKKGDRESARRRTDTHTHTHTHTHAHRDANRFYNLSHAICYSYGTDNDNLVTTGQFTEHLRQTTDYVFVFYTVFQKKHPLILLAIS